MVSAPETSERVFARLNVAETTARILGDAAALLRMLSETIGTIYSDHRDRAGSCNACEQPWPCRTRRLIETHLIPPEKNLDEDIAGDPRRGRKD